jgi:selenocysteine-specific elongation factor
MDKKHLIMGTAGHVDHGKTALIKALTGFDCDTHKQEKQRGITMNLGFTHLDLPDGNSVGIIDVPGHADFIKTMVAGACGIDFVLLIIAADEGIMHQTREHLEIMNTLGIKHGIIVLTKVDLVDTELIELAEEELREFVKDSFLENASIVKVSSVSESGMDKLLQAITDLFEKIPQRSSEGAFRLYIDRIFSQEGFGTIANGSVLSGSISKDNEVYLLPGNKELRIRRLEHHGKEVNTISAGDRASFNLVGLKQKDFTRGMVLSDREIKETRLIDAKITIFQPDVSLQLWSQVIFLLGTSRLMARMHLLNKNSISSGETCLVQIYLPKPIIAIFGDKFIIRNSSGDLTLGGGEIVDPYPLHHRRRRKDQIDIVNKLSSGDLKEHVLAEIRKAPLPVLHTNIASKLNIQPDDLIEIIFRQLPGDIVFHQTESSILLMQKKFETTTRNKILTGLQEFHKKNPLKKMGKTFNELMGIFGTEQNEITKMTLKLLLDDMQENGKLKCTNKSWSLTSHDVKLDKNTQNLVDKVESYLQDIGSNSADIAEIQIAIKEDVDEKKLRQVLNYLVDKGKAYFLQKKYFHHDFVEKAKQQLLKFLKQNPDGISVAQFRDIMECNRTNSMIILEYFDSSNITIRRGNYRFLTKKFVESRKK